MKKAKKFSISLRTRVTIIASLMMLVVCAAMFLIILRNVDVFIIGSTGINPDATQSTGEMLEPGIKTDAASDLKELAVSVNTQLFYERTLWTIIVFLLLGTILTYFVLTLSLRPLKQLQEKISRISEYDLSERIHAASGCTELDALSQSFDQLLDRLETAFVREKNFSAGAAHELKTPLTVIKTNLDVLALSEVPTQEEYEEVLSVVTKQTERMKKLVDDLFAMCSLNGYDISEKVDMEMLLHEIAAEQHLMMQEKNLQLEIQAEPCTVLANSVMLKHALSNIVQNAVKYNLDGGEVCVNETVEQGFCMIKVCDYGIGISPAAAEHIFEPFYREDQSRSRKIGGAGLGLSITKNIVEQHGGTVVYQPNQPKGACFIVRLPVKK